MPGSVTSVFSEAEDFETALREEGFLGLFVTYGDDDHLVRPAAAPLADLRRSQIPKQLMVL